MKCFFSLFLLFPLFIHAADERPNILWLTSEDNGPQLGCYGDAYADTPNLDALAASGMMYRTCWSTAPVCAAARTTLISGMYPPSTGSEHMRSTMPLPAGFKMYPQLLREAGYFVTNANKEDYNNPKVGEVWHGKDHRKRAEGQPFFAIYNETVSHESKIRNTPHTLVHDPAKAVVPAYHPDTPEVRRDWAQYYDRMTEMDARMGKHLAALEAAGLADSTIIFYYGDHGSGMPRSKRWPYNSGLHVPLIVRVPEKFKHLAPEDYAVGSTSDRLVGFIDLPATVLSLAGLKPPANYQGKAIMGPHAGPAPEVIFGFRGRMDERIDCVRTARNQTYVYLRHFHPHRIYGQHVSYMFSTRTTSQWREMFDAGELNEAQSVFWGEKPTEELYDIEADPWEVNNLADSPEHQGALKELRQAVHDWQLEIRDVGLLPESDVYTRSQGSTAYELGKTLPMGELLATAEAASRRDAADLPLLEKALGHADASIRYYAVLGYHIRGKDAVRANADALRAALNDREGVVRIAAAEALGHHAAAADQEAAHAVLIAAADPTEAGNFASIYAWNVIDDLGPDMAPHYEALKALPAVDKTAPGRTQKYIERLRGKVLK